MRAVNLMPAELRRGVGGIGRSGGAVYVLLGGLAALLLLGVLYGVADHQLADRQAELVKADQETVAAQARANALAPYTSFASLRQQRLQTVTTIAGQRFDWPTALRGIAASLPSDVHLLSLSASITGNPTGSAGAAPTSPAAGAAPQPAVSLQGCAPTHTEVGVTINRLRGLPGVSSVGFASSQKGASTSTTNSCPGKGWPVFAVTVNYTQLGATGALPSPQPIGAAGVSSVRTAPAGAISPAPSTSAPAAPAAPAAGHPAIAGQSAPVARPPATPPATSSPRASSSASRPGAPRPAAPGGGHR